MQCHHCQADTLIKAEHFGAERLFCTSCRQTSRAETFKAETKEDKVPTPHRILQYIYSIRQKPLTNQWEAPWTLSQNGIAKAVGTVRSNVSSVAASLIKQGLLTQKLYHLVDENGRTLSSKKQIAYSLTPAGAEMVRKGFKAETFEAQSRKTGVICGNKGCKGNLLETEYGGSLSKLHCDKCNYSEVMEWDAETFEASRSDLRRRRRTPFYKIERPDAEEDRDVNRYARTNAGGALWEATYQALRDEGRSHAQAEAFCNSKFFDHYYEALIEGLRRPMRKVLKDIRKANREKGRDFDKKYFIDELVSDNQVFEAPSWADTAPTPMPADRPSAPWPSPSDMITPPRRPYRRPRRRGPLPLRPHRRDV
jgi:DNA-binding MarR family transcriptional regulator